MLAKRTTPPILAILFLLVACNPIGIYSPQPTEIIPTEAPTITPTPTPTIIVDEFDNEVLDPAWAWYLPAAGPTYSLEANPDQPKYLQTEPGVGYRLLTDA